MYKYSNVEGNKYPLFYFKTSNDYEYTILLNKEYVSTIDIEVFQISVDCLNCEKPKKDLMVGKTIIYIIERFLKENPKIILAFICDDSDNQHLARKRKFCGWYKLYNVTDYDLLNFEYPIDFPKKTYYSSVIYDPKFYSKDYIVDSYNKEQRSMMIKE